MAKITEIEFVPFDTETTGVDPEEDRIVSFGASVFRAGVMEVSGARIVNPGVPIPPDASRVHGIRDHHVKNKPPLSSIAQRIVDKFATCELIVGYNCLHFDTPLLDKEMGRLGSDWRMDRSKILDLKAFVDWNHRGARPRTLEAMAELYGLKIDGQMHSAAYDTEITGKLLLAMVAKGTVPDDVDEALTRQAAYLSTVDDEFTRYSYWIYADRETGAWRMGASKNCGKLLSDVPKGSLSYLLNNIPDIPEAARELMTLAASGDPQSGLQKPMVSEPESDDEAPWGGWK
jgi:DNA polymerase-3 subunit epsilon